MTREKDPNLFKQLTETQDAEFRAWADDPENQKKEHWDKWSLYHPVIRDQWEKNGFATRMRASA